MSRTFVNVSWCGASEAYDGSQQMSHFLKSGKANIKLYEDRPVENPKKVKTPDFRTAVERSEDRLDARRALFEKAFEDGKIDFDRYNILLTEWEISRCKLDRKMGIVEEKFNDPISHVKPSIMLGLENTAKNLCERHPFAFLVASIMVGAGFLNVMGFGG